jgi:hypothetical protein
MGYVGYDLLSDNRNNKTNDSNNDDVAASKEVLSFFSANIRRYDIKNSPMRSHKNLYRGEGNT